MSNQHNDGGNSEGEHHSADRSLAEGVENIAPNEEGENEEQPKKKCDWVGWIIRIVIVLCLIGIAVWAIVDNERVSDGFEEFIDFLRDNPILAPFILIVVYAIATVLFLPGLILTLGAGFAFNEAYGNVGGKLVTISKHVYSRYISRIDCSLDRSYDWKYRSHVHW